MPILKRRLDICGREKSWEYQIEAAGRQYRVTARQIARGEPEFACSCGCAGREPNSGAVFYADAPHGLCSHISEVQRDLRIARQAAAQMIP